MFKNQTVLITGASSGIGAALARRFAVDGARLVLVARQSDRLSALADELRGRAGQVESITADLTQTDAPQGIVAEACARMGLIDVLVNNAGAGEYGEFARQDVAALDQMMRLNMTALVRLTQEVVPEMVSQQSGRILNVASMAAFQPTPYMAVYGATKSFVLSFSMALRDELRRTGVRVTCVCPGPVRTEFFSRGGYEARREEFTRLAVDADWLAERAYQALARDKAFVVPGVMNKLTVLAERLMPLGLVTRISGRILGPRR